MMHSSKRHFWGTMSQNVTPSRSASRDRCEPPWSSLPNAGVPRADSVPGTGAQWAPHGSRHPPARLGAALICIKRNLMFHTADGR
jgi:hypothetical protein